jgi:hypothetical protein
MPAALSAHSTASVRSQKYSRIKLRTMSSAETAELLLQNFSCRSQGVLRHEVSGYWSFKAGRRLLGAAARLLWRIPVWTRWRMPETILKMATKLGLEHCEVRNEVAETGNSLVENDPGTTRMSNCGAFSNEFYLRVSYLFTSIFKCGRWSRNGAGGNLFSLPDCLSDDRQKGNQVQANPARPRMASWPGVVFGVWRGIDRASRVAI